MPECLLFLTQSSKSSMPLSFLPKAPKGLPATGGESPTPLYNPEDSRIMSPRLREMCTLVCVPSRASLLPVEYLCFPFINVDHFEPLALVRGCDAITGYQIHILLWSN